MLVASALALASCGGGEDSIDARQSPLAASDPSCALRINNTQEKLLQCVTLDGVPIAEWDLQTLRRQFALVSQDVVLFNDTIAANVALSDSVDTARVTEALRSANLLDFVQTLPQGLDTPISERGGGTNLRFSERTGPMGSLFNACSMIFNDSRNSWMRTR